MASCYETAPTRPSTPFVRDGTAVWLSSGNLNNSNEPDLASLPTAENRDWHVSFETILGLASRHQPTSYWDIIGRDNPRRGVATVRRQPRRRKTETGIRPDSSPAPIS